MLWKYRKWISMLKLHVYCFHPECQCTNFTVYYKCRTKFLQHLSYQAPIGITTAQILLIFFPGLKSLDQIQITFLRLRDNPSGIPSVVQGFSLCCFMISLLYLLYLITHLNEACLYNFHLPKR